MENSRKLRAESLKRQKLDLAFDKIDLKENWASALSVKIAIFNNRRSGKLVKNDRNKLKIAI